MWPISMSSKVLIFILTNGTVYVPLTSDVLKKKPLKSLFWETKPLLAFDLSHRKMPIIVQNVLFHHAYVFENIQ